METKECVIREQIESTEVRNMSNKRCFIEYYLVSITLMISMTLSQKFGAIMFLFFSFFIIKALQIYVGQTIKEMKREKIIFGKNAVTVAFFILIIIACVRQYNTIGLSIFYLSGFEKNFINIVKMPIVFIMLFLISLCHENLYRIRLYEAVASKYLSRAKMIAFFVMLCVVELAAVTIDAAIWTPILIGMIILAIFFAIRCLLNKVNLVNNAIALAFVQCAYWIVFNDNPMLF